MTKISNTNLYYWTTVKWDGYTEYFFMQDKWGGENSSPTHRNQYAGSNKTTVFKTEFKKYHLFTTAGSKLNSTSSYSVINKTQTIKVQLKDGSNWVDATVVPADLTASTYALTSSTAAGAKSASLAKESATVSATVDAAYSAKVTLSCANVLDGYMFEGWYDANGDKITSYTVSDAHTVYARFIQSAEETNEVTVTYMCGATSVATTVAEFVGVETEKSFTAPTVSGYKFTNWTIGAGIDLKAGTASDATITVVTKSASSDYTLVANYEEVRETVYFINTNKWARVNIHKWNGKAAASSWPGEKLTASGEKIGEYDVYSYTAKQGDYANVIFNSKTSGSDGGNAQTADLVWTAGKYYIYNYGGKSGWYTKEEAEELLVVPVVTHDIVVKAVVPAAWTSTTISIHYWGEGISGTSTPVATEKDGNWNKYTIKNVPEGVSVNVIFLNGTSWPDDKSKQTANITGITEDKCFQISAAKLDSEGKCTVKEVDCDATIEPEVDVYTIMGAGELGLSWDLAKTGNDMTKQADGTYTLVKEGLDLATTGSYEYKVVKNHSWDWSIPSGNTNQTLKVDKDGTYTVTFTLSSDKKKLTANAVCTAEKEVILDCSVAGTINLVGGTSDFTDKLAMTYDEGTKTYSKTFTALPAGNYQMKVVYGSDWLGYDKLTKPVPENVTEGDDKKIKFSLAEAGDVTVTYNVEKGIGLVGNFAAPAPEAKKYYVKGTHNEWTADATSEMTLDGEVYKKEVTLAKDVEFKINDGADAWWGKDNLGGKSYNELEGVEGGNLKMKEAKTFTIIFKPTEHLITFEGLTEKAPAEPAKCYLMGNGDWDNGVEMEEDGTQFKLLAHHIYAPFKFKYGEEWSDQVENFDFPGIDWKDGNIVLPEGIYDFYFNKTTKKVRIVEAGHIRKVPVGYYATMCLPNAISNYEGAEIYEVAWMEFKDDKAVGLYLDQVAAGTTLEAGKPYIFKATAATQEFYYESEAVSPLVDGENGLRGTLNGIAAGGLTNHYIIADNKFWVATVNNSLDKNRAYIDATKVKKSEPALIPGRRRVSLGAAGENTETGVDNIITSDAPVKVIENGQLIIIRNGEKFNGQGQQL